MITPPTCISHQPAFRISQLIGVSAETDQIWWEIPLTLLKMFYSYQRVAIRAIVL